ncbi:hypothetical protein SAMN05444170_5543 [Bradyrhizobium erythrophlei]|uniref:Uncharacterized protein n=1 Tax=Bradyrhizobium erythrophlei TaxID=1437360 RepID=A0A1M7UKJ2_9BRAD|nr:hypothetical protein SAMN05444170_5543 [Bradyrhizobium erythrophlei]
MKRPPKEYEIRRLLHRAWSRRRLAASPSVRNALQLNLNRELEEPRGETVKYFFAALILQGLLYLVYNRLGIS